MAPDHTDCFIIPIVEYVLSLTLQTLYVQAFSQAYLKKAVLTKPQVEGQIVSPHVCCEVLLLIF